MANGERILVVDDSPPTVEVIVRNLMDSGYRVWSASNVTEAIRMLESAPIDLVITDMKMPRIGGLELVRHVRENFRDTQVVMITGYPSIDSAVEAVKSGADEYLAKPFTDEELLSAVEKVLATQRLHRPEAPPTDGEAGSFHGILGQSEPMREVYRAIHKAASTPATVLISGESGTGMLMFPFQPMTVGYRFFQWNKLIHKAGRGLNDLRLWKGNILEPLLVTGTVQYDQVSLLHLYNIFRCRLPVGRISGFLGGKLNID